MRNCCCPHQGTCRIDGCTSERVQVRACLALEGKGIQRGEVPRAHLERILRSSIVRMRTVETLTPRHRRAGLNQMRNDPTMKKIDENQLETDSAYRFGYTSEFIGFGSDDIDTIHSLAPALAPLVPGLVDAVYERLAQYDCTWRHFLPRQAGYDGKIPVTLEELTPDHPQIQFRKQHLARYLEKLVTAPYDGKLIVYLDMVGKIHTSKAGNQDIAVPLVQMNALLGFVADAFNATLLSADLPRDTQAKAIRAFSKLLWLQSDFISRHYAG